MTRGLALAFLGGWLGFVGVAVGFGLCRAWAWLGGRR